VTSEWPATPHLAAVEWLLCLLSSGSLPPSLMDRKLCASLKAAEVPAYSPSPAMNHYHAHDAVFSELASWTWPRLYLGGLGYMCQMLSIRQDVQATGQDITAAIQYATADAESVSSMSGRARG